MENQLNDLLEKAKKDKRTLVFLKNAAVRSQMFDLASQLRTMETELFPKTDEQKAAENIGKEMDTALRMVNVNAGEPTSWLIYKTFLKFQELGGEFSIKDAVALKFEMKHLFELSLSDED